MTAVSVSTLSDQLMSSVPEPIQENSFTTISLPSAGPNPMRMKTNTDSAAAISSAAQVTIWAGRSPITRQKRPAIPAATSGRKTMSLMARSMVPSAPSPSSR